MTAETAPVIWTDLPELDVVDARSLAKRNHPDCSSDVTRIASLRQAYLAADGTQVLVLKSSSHHLYLIVRGVRVTTASVDVVFEIDGIKSVSSAPRRMAILAALLQQEHPALLPNRPGLVERIELRDALITLDGRCAGASYRDIASVIYGADRVHKDWTNPDSALRQRVKRNLVRGNRMMTGGYRVLLAGRQTGSLRSTL